MMPGGQKSLHLALLLLLCAPAAGASKAPVAVSPGTSAGALIGGACPTFSWGAVEGAKSYELVVYAVGEGDEGAEPTLKQGIPGSALSWTPSLKRCLERGGQYAWSVRAIGPKEVTGWSTPSLFQVAPRPTMDEFEAVLELLRRYELSGRSAPEGHQPALLGAQPSTAKTAIEELQSPASASAPAALRAELPDLAGESYGVIGTSKSPAGGGVGAVNTAGGADLVLDGSADGEADTRVSQSGLDRPSSDDQYFIFENSGSLTNGMSVEVKGQLKWLPVMQFRTATATTSTETCSSAADSVFCALTRVQHNRFEFSGTNSYCWVKKDIAEGSWEVCARSNTVGTEITCEMACFGYWDAACGSIGC